jgi:hypothetical protein
MLIHFQQLVEGRNEFVPQLVVYEATSMAPPLSRWAWCREEGEGEGEEKEERKWVVDQRVF